MSYTTNIELYEGTHYHTRNLAPMLLAAKARKTLRPPITPQLQMGDALLFDYRILHRGRANMSDVVDESDGALDEVSGQDGDCERDGTNGGNRSGMNEVVGKDRPVLVMTFAKRWFVDVCNFPKHSLFSLGRC